MLEPHCPDFIPGAIDRDVVAFNVFCEIMAVHEFADPQSDTKYRGDIERDHVLYYTARSFGHRGIEIYRESEKKWIEKITQQCRKGQTDMLTIIPVTELPDLFDEFSKKGIMINEADSKFMKLIADKLTNSALVVVNLFEKKDNVIASEMAMFTIRHSDLQDYRYGLLSRFDASDLPTGYSLFTQDSKKSIIKRKIAI